MRHVIPISGKDSLATAILQTALKPDFDYEFCFNPTGLDLPETLEWIDKVEAYLNKPIIRVGADLKEIIKGYNYFLPNGQSRYCTRQAKIEPFIDWIGKEECFIYYGIRADEERAGFNNTLSPNIIPVYPLKENNINLNGVYILVNRMSLKPPTFFWKRLHERVCNILGFDPINFLPEWLFDMLFAWRSRSNCDRCFNQRYYEWVGLLEHHPLIFWDAESYEHLGGDKIYTWSSNKKSLQQIANEAEKIFNKRVNAVVNFIRTKQQVSLFPTDKEENFYDILSTKSCGLFCGK